MSRYCLQHEGSSWVAIDDYGSLKDAIEATAKKTKHRGKVVKIYEDRSGGYRGYYLNGEEVKGYTF